jgi:hypothetical protein
VPAIGTGDGGGDFRVSYSESAGSSGPSRAILSPRLRVAWDRRGDGGGDSDRPPAAAGLFRGRLDPFRVTRGPGAYRPIRADSESNGPGHLGGCGVTGGAGAGLLAPGWTRRLSAGLDPPPAGRTLWSGDGLGRRRRRRRRQSPSPSSMRPHAGRFARLVAVTAAARPRRRRRGGAGHAGPRALRRTPSRRSRSTAATRPPSASPRTP